MFARSSTVGLPIRRRGSTLYWSRSRTWERNKRKVRVKVLASKMRGSRLTRRKRESNPKVALHLIMAVCCADHYSQEKICCNRVDGSLCYLAGFCGRSTNYVVQKVAPFCVALLG